MKINRTWLATVTKYVWYIVVIVFATAYVWRNFDTVVLTISHLSPEKIAFTLVALIFGKICLCLNMKYSLFFIGKHVEYIPCFHIYNISQLGKYIPGNFWHFIGRIGFYKNEDMSFKEIRSSMVLEIIFIITGSFFWGLVFLFMSPDFLNIISQHFPSAKTFLLVGVMSVIFTIVLMAIVKREILARVWRAIHEKRGLSFKIIAIQFIIWLFLGMSFFSILTPYASGIKVWLFTIGLFAFSYLIGFLFVIAPAGIGVRELVLISGLSLINIPSDIAISVVGLHRILYIIAEIFLAVSGSVLFFFYRQDSVFTDR